MIKLIKGKYEHKMIYKGKTIFRLYPNQPFISFGYGKASYKMKRGSFKIRDKVEKVEYLYKRINDGEQITIGLEDKSKNKLSIDLTEINDRLHIKFPKTKQRFNRAYIKIAANVEENVYGCGEQFAKFNLRGEKVKIWVSEHVALSDLLTKAMKYQLKIPIKTHKFSHYSSYMVQPTFITSDKLFCHIATGAYVAFDFSRPDHFECEIREYPREIIIGVEDTFETLMENLTGYLGRQPELPDWVYNGIIAGIQDGTKVCDKKIMQLQESGAKISGIWAQDWEGQRITAFGKQLYWNWVYDKKLYSDLKEQIKKWNKESIVFLGYINPFLAIEGELYQEASAKGYLVKNKKGDEYLVKITTFPAAMIDLTHPEAYEWIKNIIKENMIKLGMRGWMADFGEYLPTDAVLYKKVSSEDIHNMWPVLWAKVNREAIEETGRLGQVVFFTRAGYTGTSKYSTLMWNGDQHVDWTRDFGIGSIVNSQLSLSVTGLGLSHSDVGGYTAFGKMKRSKELLLRWAEMSAFSCVMRSHEGNRPDDNWQFDGDNETLRHIARFSRIYAHLKEYIKDAVHTNAERGIPVIRPLFFYYNESFCYETDHTYLLGRDILVHPIVEPSIDKTEVTLPDDQWVHVWNGEKFTKGKWIIDCPVGYPPLFYRERSKYRDLFESIKHI